ncbi:MAG: TM2 domain-containing protein [Planctomycetota bacterium]|jgi:hypothetical protein
MAEDRRSPAVAFLLSIIPGAGHLYAGNIGGGIMWLFILVLMYQGVPGLAWVIHFFCAVSAMKSAVAANRRERQDLQGREESAEEFGRMLDRAVERSPLSPEQQDSHPAPGPEADPPPRLVRGAYSAAPHVLLDALRTTMAQQGLDVASVDAERLRVVARLPIERGMVAPVIAQVEATPAGSRVRMILDRPVGAPRDPELDDARLREILANVEAAMASVQHMPGYREPAAVATAEPEDAGMSELEFLEDLREAWDAYEQGWMPEDEWIDRKAELIRELILRPDTRLGDFMSACRPLTEAGILTPEDLKAIQDALR